MNAAAILNFPERDLCDAPKRELIKMVVSLCDELRRLQIASDKKIVDLQAQLAEKDAKLAKITKEVINKTINQPSSKQPEFNKDTNSNKKRKKRKKKSRWKKRCR